MIDSTKPYAMYWVCRLIKRDNEEIWHEGHFVYGKTEDVRRYCRRQSQRGCKCWAFAYSNFEEHTAPFGHHGREAMYAYYSWKRKQGDGAVGLSMIGVIPVEKFLEAESF